MGFTEEKIRNMKFGSIHLGPSSSVTQFIYFNLSILVC